MRASHILLSTCVVAGLVLAGCGDSSKSSDTTPTDAPKASGPAKSLVDGESKTPAKGDGEIGEIGETVDTLAGVAEALGLEVTDENRAMLQQVADAVGDEATQEQILEMAKQVGLGDALGEYGEKVGLGKDDMDGDLEDVATKKAGDLLDGALSKGDDDEDDKAKAPSLDGLNKTQLRARRTAANKRIAAARDKELAELRGRFEVRKKKNPDMVATLDERMAAQEKLVTAKFEKRLTAMRARFKAAIAKAPE